MKEKIPLLYTIRGRLNPSEAPSDWFEKKTYSMNDLAKDLSSTDVNNFLPFFFEMILEDELNLNMFLECMGEFKEVAKGIFHTTSTINPLIKNIKVTTSAILFERIEAIILDFDINVGHFFQLKASKAIDIQLSTDVVIATKKVSTNCRLVMSYNNGDNSQRTQVFLIYHRNFS